MPSEDTTVAEPTGTDASAATDPKPTSDADVASSAPSTEPERVNITHPSSGEPISMTYQERDWLAQRGLVALAEKREANEVAAANPEPDKPKAPDPVVVDESGEVDPAAKKMSELDVQIQRTTQSLAKLEEREQQRQAADDAKGRQDSRRRMLDAVAKQHGLEDADPVYREMVENRANNLADRALAEGRVVTYEECHKNATREIGDRVAEGARTQWEGKKKVREAAAEPSAGASVAEMAPPVFAKTKAEERKLASEMVDGSITVRANERFQKIMGGSGV